LDKVVALVRISCQSVGKPAQARQKIYDLEARVACHGALFPDRFDNGWPRRLIPEAPANRGGIFRYVAKK
jgi:hypothetical protein